MQNLNTDGSNARKHGAINQMPEDLVVFIDCFSEGELVVKKAPWPEDDEDGIVWLISQLGRSIAVAGSEAAAVAKVIELSHGWGVWCLGPAAGLEVDAIGIRPIRSGWDGDGDPLRGALQAVVDATAGDLQ